MSIQAKQITWNVVPITVAGAYVANPGDMLLCNAPGPVSVTMPIDNGKPAIVKNISIFAVSLTNLTAVDASFALLREAQSVTTMGDGANPYVVAIVPAAGPPP